MRRIAQKSALNTGDRGSQLAVSLSGFSSDEIGQGLSLNNFRLVIDSANGAASSLAPHLFEQLGASVVAINDKPDGRNINRDCGSLHIEKLAAEGYRRRVRISVLRLMAMLTALFLSMPKADLSMETPRSGC